MGKFTKIVSPAAPMPAANIDTDIMMPKAFLKRIDKEGVFEGFFHDLRVLENGAPNPEFVLNQAEYKGAKILVTGPNFGCGSSREHAVWGLQSHGIRVLIGSSFAGIFFDNCANNGILAVILTKPEVDAIIENLQKSDDKALSVDLAQQTVTDADGKTYRFEIDAGRKDLLLNGLDAVGLTLREEKKIATFEKDYFKKYPWLNTDF